MRKIEHGWQGMKEVINVSKYEGREEFLYFDNWHRLSGVEPTVTIRVHRWHYHTPRVKLTLIEGYYETDEKIVEAIRKASFGEFSSQSFPTDYPKHFQILMRPHDMQRLAQTLAEVCESEK